MLVYVAEEFDSALSIEVDYSAADLGLEADAFAERCFNNFSYCFGTVYCTAHHTSDNVSYIGRVNIYIASYSEEIKESMISIG